MKKINFLLILLSIVIAISVFLVNKSYALPSDPDINEDAGHRGLTKLSTNIKKNLPESQSNGLMNQLEIYGDTIHISNVAEDGAAGMYGALHFYDPTTGLGYMGLFPNAKETADDWYNQALFDYCYARQNSLSAKSAWADFGHVLHLTQDMVTPAHTNNVSHILGDSFENYVRDNWDAWQNDAILGYKYNPITQEYEPIKGPLPDEAKIIKSFDANGPVYYTGLKEYLEDYMSRIHYDPSIYQLTDVSSYIELLDRISHDFPVDRSKTLPILSEHEISWSQRRQNVETLLPLALMYGAGLINTFWKDVNSIPTSQDICKKLLLEGPGGDHPDDTFDVSDDFYLNKNFNLSFEELTNLKARTGIKKGKAGVIYLKQALDIYIKGMTATTDAEKQAAEQKLNELGKITIPNGAKYRNDIMTAPDIALFTYGFYNPLASLLLKYKEPTVFIDLNFEPSVVTDHPVMVIPSGGLYGLENSVMLKAQFAEYVKQGGTLIVFAQQHGYEFNILPVPQEADGTYKTITGYGWTEDQSCFTNAAYIDTYHQILSGQNRSTPSLNVDGYFTDYPSNATVFLRRTVNGQPAMVMYDYGQGKVIVTSMYSDWAYGHSQATQDEISL